MVKKQCLSVANLRVVAGRPIHRGRTPRRAAVFRRATAGGNRKGYAGYENDGVLTSSQFYHVRYRVYNAFIGRWLTRDPMEYLGGLSLYRYLNVSPLKATDPFGLVDPISCAAACALCAACAASGPVGLINIVSCAGACAMCGACMGELIYPVRPFPEPIPEDPPIDEPQPGPGPVPGEQCWCNCKCCIDYVLPSGDMTHHCNTTSWSCTAIGGAGQCDTMNKKSCDPLPGLEHYGPGTLESCNLSQHRGTPQQGTQSWHASPSRIGQRHQSVRF